VSSAPDIFTPLTNKVLGPRKAPPATRFLRSARMQLRTRIADGTAVHPYAGVGSVGCVASVFDFAMRARL
jgi:hypothetical protein